MHFKIALADSDDIRPYGEYLKSTGLDIHYIATRTQSEEETITNLQGYDGIVACGELFTEKVCSTLAGQLKIIARFGLGYDKVDLAAAAANGICVTNTAGTMAAGVADCAFLLMLECLRRFAYFNEDMHKGLWRRNFMGTSLEGKTVGIIGFGSIGQRFAQYCTGFACNLIAYDVHFNEEAQKRLGVKRVSLDELFEQSDIISVHCPLIEQTKGIVSKEMLAKMKRTAFLINTSRGGTVDEPALIAALKEGRIAGAGLDVFWNEPLEDNSALRGMDNVIMTPHIASSTYESMQECAQDVGVSLHAFLKGEVPVHCLNPDYINHVR